MPSIREAYLPPLTPTRPCTPVVPMRPRAQPAAAGSSAPWGRQRAAVDNTDPFLGPVSSSGSAAAVPAYVLQPPRTPRQPQHEHRRTDRSPVGRAPFDEERADARAARRGLTFDSPISPTPHRQGHGVAFASFETLPITYLSQEAWDDSCCSIMQEPLAALKEPVAVHAREALHIFEYQHLKTWLRTSKQMCDAPAQFINPRNGTWTPLSALRRPRPMPLPEPIDAAQQPPLGRV